MIVVDASVIVDAFVYSDGRGERAIDLLARDTQWTAPEHWTLEVFSAIRRLLRLKSIDERTAAEKVALLPQLGVQTVSVHPLLGRRWELRHEISPYDVPYVALASSHDLTFVTSDKPLASAASQHCRVELVHKSGEDLV
jgi:predicted nucleic acid-binding protein